MPALPNNGLTKLPEANFICDAGRKRAEAAEAARMVLNMAGATVLVGGAE